jgi:hypothetical protein
MHYDRLTYKDKSLPRIGSDGRLVEAYCDYSVREIINRLAELEDMIENGELIELPVPLGTDVYYVNWEYTDDEYSDKRVWFVEKNQFAAWMLDSWGVDLFATEEEALECLEEERLKNG